MKTLICPGEKIVETPTKRAALTLAQITLILFLVAEKVKAGILSQKYNISGMYQTSCFNILY